MRDIGDLTADLAGPKINAGWLVAITPTGLPPVYLSTIRDNFNDNTVSPPIVYLGDPGVIVNRMFVNDRGEATLSLDIPVSDDGPVRKSDVEAGLYNGASVVVEVLAYLTLRRSIVGFRWSIGGGSLTDDGRARFEVRADTRIRQELILKTYGPGCKNNLGDSRCGVDVLGEWTDEVTVASVIDAYSFTITGARGGAVDDFFANGAIKFTSGDNIDLAYAVRKWDQSESLVTLWEPLRAGLEIGDEALIHAGCDKTKGANGCARFSNFARRLAYDNLPPDDAKFAYEEPVQQTVVTNPQPVSNGWAAAGTTSGGGF